MPFQARHRAQRAGRALDEASGRQVAEVIRGQIREQRQSHVGRRRAMRNHGHGMLLHIVRRQPIVFRADEGLEERPGFAGNGAQKAGLVGRQAGSVASQRATHPPRQRGRGQPQQQDRRGHAQDHRVGRRQTQRRHHRERGSHPHHPVESDEVPAPLAIQVARRGPFEQALVADPQPPERANHGIQAKERLVRQANEGEGGLRQMLARRAGGGGEMLAPAHIAGLAQHVQERGGQRGDQQDAEHRQGPEPRRCHHRPAQHQQQGQGRRRETAPQVVGQFPAGQDREGVLPGASVETGNPWQQPRRNLPVPANPAVPPVHVRAIARGIVLVQLHVGEQPRTRVAPFQQVVAEDAVLGEAPVERLLEGIDFVDALADERTFLEPVLVDVGDRVRIRVDTGVAPVQPRIPRPVGAGQAHGHAGLQDAVALADPLPVRVVARPIQRVRHGAHQFPRRVARQLGIGVQGNDVLHVRQERRIPDDPRKTLLIIAAQQRVQIRQLAALALVTHPNLFLRIPAARAMEQEERVAPVAWVLFVQRFDPLRRQLHQRCILRQRFLLRVPKIGQQAKVQVIVPIGQEPDFQRFDQILDVLRAGEHRRRHHQGAHFRRNTPGKVHARQRPGRGQQRRQPVHQRHRQMTGPQHREDHQEREQPTRHAIGLRLRQQTPGEERRQQRHRTQIQG